MMEALAGTPVLGNLYMGRSGVQSSRGIKQNPEVVGSATAATAAQVRPFIATGITCHSCHYKRDLILNCPTAMETGGRHAFCANCLRRRCNVDFHAIRTGLVNWVCPVCSGACPCANCKRANDDKVMPYEFGYDDSVNLDWVSTASGGRAIEPHVQDFSDAGRRGGKPIVIRMVDSCQGKSKSKRLTPVLVRVPPVLEDGSPAGPAASATAAGDGAPEAGDGAPGTASDSASPGAAGTADRPASAARTASPMSGAAAPARAPSPARTTPGSSNGRSDGASSVLQQFVRVAETEDAVKAATKGVIPGVIPDGAGGAIPNSATVYVLPLQLYGSLAICLLTLCTLAAALRTLPTSLLRTQSPPSHSRSLLCHSPLSRGSVPASSTAPTGPSLTKPGLSVSAPSPRRDPVPRAGQKRTSKRHRAESRPPLLPPAVASTYAAPHATAATTHRVVESALHPTRAVSVEHRGASDQHSTSHSLASAGLVMPQVHVTDPPVAASLPTTVFLPMASPASSDDGRHFPRHLSDGHRDPLRRPSPDVIPPLTFTGLAHAGSPMGTSPAGTPDSGPSPRMPTGHDTPALTPKLSEFLATANQPVMLRAHSDTGIAGPHLAPIGRTMGTHAHPHVHGCMYTGPQHSLKHDGGGQHPSNSPNGTPPVGSRLHLLATQRDDPEHTTVSMESPVSVATAPGALDNVFSHEHIMSARSWGEMDAGFHAPWRSPPLPTEVDSVMV